MSRVTLTRVRAHFEQIKTIATKRDVTNADRWRLVEGSATYGQSWGIVEVDPANGGQRPVIRFGYTRTEAAWGLNAFEAGLTIGLEG